MSRFISIIFFLLLFIGSVGLTIYFINGVFHWFNVTGVILFGFLSLVSLWVMIKLANDDDKPKIDKPKIDKPKKLTVTKPRKNRVKDVFAIIGILFVVLLIILIVITIVFGLAFEDAIEENFRWLRQYYFLEL